MKKCTFKICIDKKHSAKVFQTDVGGFINAIPIGERIIDRPYSRTSNNEDMNNKDWDNKKSGNNLFIEKFSLM
jgi:hypothetical protein